MLYEAFYDSTDCSGTASSVPIRGAGGSFLAVLGANLYGDPAFVIGECNLYVLLGTSTTQRSLRIGTGGFTGVTSTAFVDADCTTTVAPNVPFLVSCRQDTQDSTVSRNFIVQDIPASKMIGVAHWDPTKFTGATSSTCYPEIRGLSTTDFGANAESWRLLEDNCLVFLSESFMFSSGVLRHYSNTACSGAGVVFDRNQCTSLSGMARTVFFGDLGPTAQPTNTPTDAPTSTPSFVPTSTPSIAPTASPSAQPSTSPSGEPTFEPSGSPSFARRTIATVFGTVVLPVLVVLLRVQ